MHLRNTDALHNVALHKFPILFYSIRVSKRTSRQHLSAPPTFTVTQNASIPPARKPPVLSLWTNYLEQSVISQLWDSLIIVGADI